MSGFTFQRVPKQPQRTAASGLYLRIYRHGSTAISTEAFSMLGSPRRIEVFMDPNTTRLGMRKARADDDEAYTVSQSAGGVRCTLLAPLRRLGVQGQHLVAPGYWEGDMLVFDLSGGGDDGE